jgi:hypothetical protein
MFAVLGRIFISIDLAGVEQQSDFTMLLHYTCKTLPFQLHVLYFKGVRLAGIALLLVDIVITSTWLTTESIAMIYSNGKMLAVVMCDKCV